jgi:hypothetical protein
MLFVLASLTVLPSAVLAATPPAPAPTRPAALAPPKVTTPKATTPKATTPKATTPAAKATKAAADVPKGPPTKAEIGEAVGFAARLAPRTGFAYSVDAWWKLDEPSRAVLNTFAKARNFVNRVAGEQGLGKVVTEMNPELAPDQIEGDLELELSKLPAKPGRARYAAADAAKILRRAAKEPGIDALMKDVLLESAAAWDSRAGDGAWLSSLKLVRAPRPQPEPVVFTVAKKASPPLWNEEHWLKADSEWKGARRAMGYGPEYRELQQGYDFRQISSDPLDTIPEPRIRAFTYDSWMNYRMEALRTRPPQ